MTIELEVQRATRFQPLPGDRQFEQWARAALGQSKAAILTLRIVGLEEMRRLNRRYRGKDAATNVLSFPADLPGAVDLPLLGDVVLCAPLVIEEAQMQGKSPDAHWAHLTIHGILHLLGHDHVDPAEAAAMEGLEIELLGELGIGNPYD
ncbi:MAG TPA: rRNA maturation RNase YbeY [Xanthomonadales bacterium]|nr:rRNA maturation RNase YbeY [Xanthomonadales bacterium]